MLYIILTILCVLVAIFGPKLTTYIPGIKNIGTLGKVTIRVIASLGAIYYMLSTSIIIIPADKVGHIRQIYGTSNLSDGHIIAANGENGFQAETIPPGTFKISLFFNVYNEVEYLPLVRVPNGVYARIVARDGNSNLREGQIIADAWSDEKFSNFLDAKYFMNHGQRGLQLSVLKPGTYPINLKLFEIRIGYQPNGKDIIKHIDEVYDAFGYHTEESPLDTTITRVPSGFVGVVRSSVQETGVDCKPKKATANEAITESLSAVLVPQGCKGIWETVLSPNDYYLNRDAYDVVLVDTRVQTLDFKGGYMKREIDLTIGPNGDFEQKERTIPFIAKPDDSADVAVLTKVEGWGIPQELRAVIQISPLHAPIIVAAVGGLIDVEKRIIIPGIRSRVRNVFGGEITITIDGKQITRQTKVLDTVEQRVVLEQAILAAVREDGNRAGIDVKEIRLGDSIIPPELLLARQREQLATQLQAAFVQETAAQNERRKVSEARANADQQGVLVKARIDNDAAKLKQEQRKSEGTGERLYLQEVALGQKAQTEVLGADRVFMGEIAKMVIAAVKEHPDILGSVKLPQYLFVGGGDSVNGMGMLATSPILKQMLNQK